jgi:protein TonB
MLITSAFAGNCSAQQPTDLDKLVAPIAEAISHSGKHRVVVFPVYNPDSKSSELGAWLTKQVSARLAARVPGLELIDTTSWPLPDQAGALSETPPKNSGRMKDLEKKAGTEIIVSGSFSVLENGLGISLDARVFGKDKWIAFTQGLIAITAEMPPPPKETPSEQSGEKISRAGVGGAGIPRCIRCDDPIYPTSEAPSRGGKVVVLRLVVEADGRVSNIQVIKAPSQAFADSAVDAMRKARFKPARGPDGNPVRVLVNYEITFILER